MGSYRSFIPVLLCISAVHVCSAQVWSQLGPDVDGEAIGDFSGCSVSMPDAVTLAVGAYGNDANGSTSGHVRVLVWDGSAWVQKGSDIDGQSPGDQSGFAVSMPDENTVAVGANLHDASGIDAGQVRVHGWNGSDWIQVGQALDGAAAGDRSGQALCMPDANTLAVGAYFNDGNGSNAGHVRVYVFNGTTWVQKGVDVEGALAGDQFGYSVSMPDANTLAVGSNYADPNGIESGEVRVFAWIMNAWVQRGSVLGGEGVMDTFGHAVSMPDANTVAVGAPGNDDAGNNAGHVRVFAWSGTDWAQQGADIDGVNTFGLSGCAVSMPDAETVAIGAYLDPDGGAEAGKVRVFEWSGSAWQQVGVDLDGESANDRSGFAVSMPDPQVLAIGAPLNDGPAMDAGHVRVFGTASSTNVAQRAVPGTVLAFPNPATDHLWIAGFPAASGLGELVIRDAMGRAVLTSVLASDNDRDPTSCRIPIGTLAEGTYFLEFHFNDRSGALPFMKH